MTMDLVHEYVRLIARKRELEAELRQVKEELGDTAGYEPGKLERRVIAYFEQNGMQSTRVNGMMISLNRRLWAHAKDGDYPAACQALRDAGLGEFVQPRFNVQTLSSWVREQDRDGEPLPPAFEGRIEVAEVFRLGVTRS